MAVFCVVAGAVDAVAIEDDAVNVVRRTCLVLLTVAVAAVAFPVQSLDRKTSLSVNSVPRIVFLLV